MSLVKATVHGIASIIVVIVGAIIADAIKRNFEVFEMVSDKTIYLATDFANLPISDEIAGVLLPVGLLMGIWVFIYEIKTITS